MNATTIVAIRSANAAQNASELALLSRIELVGPSEFCISFAERTTTLVRMHFERLSTVESRGVQREV
jgi:hypothetical protein